MTRVRNDRVRVRQLTTRGQQLMDAGQFAQAAVALEELEKLKKNDFRTLLMLGTAQLMSAQPVKARKTLQRASRLEPDTPDVFCRIAASYKQERRFDDAYRMLDRALRLDPDFLDAIWCRGEYMRIEGRYREAYEFLKPYAERSPVHPGVASTFAMVAPRFDSTEVGIEALQRAMSQRGVAGNVREAQLMFQLGRLLDKAKRYDEAFATFQRANEMRGVKYDRPIEAEKVARLIREWNQGMLKRLSTSGVESTRPVFILGMPRSGTSLTEQILACHPDVFGAGELHDIGEIARETLDPSGGDVVLAHQFGALTQQSLARHAHRYLQHLKQIDRNARYITDKAPFNYEHLGLISLLFPNTRIIHCVRNPLDTCLSIYFQDFLGTHRYAYDLRTIAFRYLDYHELMEHWKSVLSLPVLEIRYEDLIERQEEITRELLEFLDLPWDEGCLKFHESDRPTITSSAEQVREPIYRTAMARWRNYEKHIGPMRETLGDFAGVDDG